MRRVLQHQAKEHLHHEIDKKHREEEEAAQQAGNASSVDAMNELEPMMSASSLVSESSIIRGQSVSSATDESRPRRQSTFARMKRRMRRRRKIIDPNHVLKYGDVITLSWPGHNSSLRNSVDEGLVTADGFLSKECYVQCPKANFTERRQKYAPLSPEDSMFRVLPKMYFDASEELNMMERKKKLPTIAEENIFESAERHRLLLESYDREQRINESRQREKSTQQESALFGKLVQLQHVQSGCWLTAHPSDPALVESHNIQVALTSSPSAYSWWAILPRHRINKIGTEIQFGSVVKLVSGKMPSHSLHIADTICESIHSRARTVFADNAQSHELNCSQFQSFFHINPVHTATIERRVDQLWTQSLVRIEHVESGGFLSWAKKENASKPEERELCCVVQDKQKNKRGQVAADSLWKFYIEEKDDNEAAPSRDHDGAICWNSAVRIMSIIIGNSKIKGSFRLCRLQDKDSTDQSKGSVFVGQRFYILNLTTGKYLSILNENAGEGDFGKEGDRKGVEREGKDKLSIVWKSECDPSDAFFTVLIKESDEKCFKFGQSAAWFLYNLSVFLKSTELATLTSVEPHFHNDIENRILSRILDESANVLEELTLFSYGLVNTDFSSTEDRNRFESI